MSKPIGLLALAIALAGCGRGTQAPGAQAGPDGNLRYGELTFKSCALSVARVPSV